MSTISKNLNSRKVSKSTIPKSHNQTFLPHGSASASPDCIMCLTWEHTIKGWVWHTTNCFLDISCNGSLQPSLNPHWVQLTNRYNGWTSNPSKCPLTSTQKSILCCSIPVWLNRLLPRKIRNSTFNTRKNELRLLYFHWHAYICSNFLLNLEIPLVSPANSNMDVPKFRNRTLSKWTMWKLNNSHEYWEMHTLRFKKTRTRWKTSAEVKKRLPDKDWRTRKKKHTEG